MDGNNRILTSLLLIALPAISFDVLAQSWENSWVYIENKATGLVVDVQGNIKETGTSVWPFQLNRSKSQIFKFSQINTPEGFGSDARYIMAYDGSSIDSDLYVSIMKRPLGVSAGTNRDTSAGVFGLALVETMMATEIAPGHSTRKILGDYLFSIQEKIEVENSGIPFSADLSLVSDKTPKQVWKVIPVPNEDGAYFIQSAHFDDNIVIEPLDGSSGGTLVVSEFTGSDLQKWRIRRTRPNDPENLRLSNFRWASEKFLFWGSNKVKGKLSWTNNNTDLSHQTVYVRVDGNTKSFDIGPNENSYEFAIPSSNSVKNKEHCFNVIARGKWAAQNTGVTDQVCETIVSPTPPQPPASSGISKLVVSNCHNDRKQVRLWTYDVTTNNGSWKDEGTLNSQWQGSGCPVGSPKEIAISDNHTYVLVAIDCGSAPPHQTQGNCHKLTSAQIQGGANGGTLVFQIN